MITVVLLSDSSRCHLAQALELLPGGRFVLSFGAAGPFRAGETIAVLSDLLAAPPEDVQLPAGCPAILSGENQAAVEFTRRWDLLPLDCGLSLRDTLTLSSRTSSSVVIALQRPVKRLDGTVLEPVEIPISLTQKWAPYPLLCCAGVLLLSDGPSALLESGLF